jgi:hypothetical protein
MTSSWHPAAITLPVAAAALMAATSWAVAGNSATSTANAAPASSQHAQVRKLSQAIDGQRTTLHQLESAIAQTKAQIKQEKRAAAAATTTTTTSPVAPAPVAPAPQPVPVAPPPPPPPPPPSNTTTGSS